MSLYLLYNYYNITKVENSMNAEKIKDILEAYLRATYTDIRIYREKKIGASICDMLAVTKCLEGFEIKSDLDNYERLDRQIKAYDTFFDKNYIVVGKSHLKSAFNKVPTYWGIICIDEQRLSVERKAKLNKNSSTRHQLDILWKIELKNILVKNNMPMYALSSTRFIADKIAENVPQNILSEQIVNELKSRDYTFFEENDDCPMEFLDMMSEQDFSSFTLDKWINLYERAKSICSKKNFIFENKADTRKPNEIPYTQIEVSLGVPWISSDIVQDFICSLLEFGKVDRSSKDCLSQLIIKDYLRKSPNFVFNEQVTGHWFIERKSLLGSTFLGTNTYGTPKYNALQIIESTLNLREIKIHTDGKYDEAETLAVLEKQALICDTFKKWVWQDEDRRWEIENAYNKLFAELGGKTYDGSKLVFNDISNEIKLRPYQKDAVKKIIDTPNTLLAFDVGAGKTFIMISAGMYMRQNGQSIKNMYVVPNNIIGQWEKMFTTLYPNAKVLTVDPKSFSGESRNKILKQMKYGDYDGIIIAYSCFEMIPLSGKYLKNLLDKKIANLSETLQELKKVPCWSGETTPLEREKKYIVSLLTQMQTSLQQDIGIYFDDLNINTLFVDEAHNYKNIPIRTALKNLRGINTTGSLKCLDMLEKVRYVQASNGGRGVVFATGTPLCNSISDAYAMQTYLFEEELQKRNLNQFDNWVKTFAQPEQVCEIDVDTSKFRVVRRFSKFFNLPELSKLFGEMTIFYSNASTELPSSINYKEVKVKSSKTLKDYMHALCERSEKIRAKEVDKSQDNMLKVSIDGRKSALDLTLVGEVQPYDNTSKVVHCVQNVLNTYNNYKGCSQLIFCDYSTPKGEDFSVYKEVKKQLINNGIPAKEIAFVHSCKNEESKLKLYKMVNDGLVRVLIGSTFKLGIGANVQTKLKAIHHLDVPWRPADMVQRDGRIIRRGNENNEIFIYRYITEGSFDAYSWQILETKQRFISQFLSGTALTRTLSDLENNVLTYGEVKALALSDPRMKMIAEKENEIRSIRILSIRDCELKDELKQQNIELAESLEKLQAKVQKSNQNVEYAKSINVDTSILKSVCAKIPKNVDILQSDTYLFEIYGFEFYSTQTANSKKQYLKAIRNKVDYFVEISDSLSGNVTRIKNFLSKIDTITQNMQDECEKIKTKINLNNQIIAKQSDYQTKLLKLEKEYEKILNQIKYDQEAIYEENFIKHIETNDN